LQQDSGSSRTAAAVRSGNQTTGTTMMQRTRSTSGILLSGVILAVVAGCERQVFLEKADYDAALSAGPLAKLSMQPHGPILPPTVQGSPPATVLDPSRPARYVTLKECVAIMLEQGNAGSPAVNQPGQIQDTFETFTQRGVSGTDSLAAFALDPAIAGAEVERSLSKFDARWVSSMTWQKTDQPFPVQFQSFLQNADIAVLSSTLAKPLPTGGVAGITFNMNYNNLTNPPPPGSAFAALPTSYTPQLQFTFEQPLLQAFGVEINQLLPTHPGSTLIPGLRPSGGQNSEGILITRLRLGQQRAEFDREVNLALLNLEAAYWNLYSAYYNLYAQEEALKQSQFAFLVFRDRARAGITRNQFAIQAQAQVELFRGQVLIARGQVLQAERQLRGLMGMRSDDGTRLVPADEPTLVPYRPDYYTLANEAMQYRPELAIARQELKIQQLNLVTQRNLRRPDLRFISQYDIAGIGSRLDGRPGENALANFIDNRFNSWTVGLRLDMPIGFRDANAAVRQAELNLRRNYFFLLDSERKTLEFLTEQYRQVIQTHELVKYRRAQRESLQRFIQLDRQVLESGALSKEEYVGFITNLIQVQRDLANATASEFQAVAQYNIALAGLEYAKGTIQQYNNLMVTDGPVPAWVEKKAVDHFKTREAALKLREHPAGLPLTPLHEWQPLGSLPGTDPLIVPPGGTAPGGVPLPLSPSLAGPEEPQATTPGVPNNSPGSDPSRPWERGSPSQPLPRPNPIPPLAPMSPGAPAPSLDRGTESPSRQASESSVPRIPVSVPSPSPLSSAAQAVSGEVPVDAPSRSTRPGTIVFPQEGTVKLRKPRGETIPASIPVGEKEQTGAGGPANAMIPADKIAPMPESPRLPVGTPKLSADGAPPTFAVPASR
jgi:outer membrane protein TolC